MIVENEKMKEKIEKYHEMLRNNEDTTVIKSEIYAMTNVYSDNKNTELNNIQNNYHEISNDIKLKDVKDFKSIKKEYLRLIDLYRKSLEISKDISKYKKYLRGVKK